MMEFKRVTEIGDALKCLPFESEIRSKKRDNIREKDFLAYLQVQLENPFFYFVICEDEIIKGYAMWYYSVFLKDMKSHIVRIYAKDKELKERFREIIKDVNKVYGVKKSVITTDRHIKALQRMGWKVVSVNMENNI